MKDPMRSRGVVSEPRAVKPKGRDSVQLSGKDRGIMHQALAQSVEVLPNPDAERLKAEIGRLREDNAHWSTIAVAELALEQREHEDTLDQLEVSRAEVATLRAQLAAAEKRAEAAERDCESYCDEVKAFPGQLAAAEKRAELFQVDASDLAVRLSAALAAKEEAEKALAMADETAKKAAVAFAERGKRIAALEEGLEAIIALADRKTAEFDKARALVEGR